MSRNFLKVHEIQRKLKTAIQYYPSRKLALFFDKYTLTDHSLHNFLAP